MKAFLVRLRVKTVDKDVNCTAGDEVKDFQCVVASPCALYSRLITLTHSHSRNPWRTAQGSGKVSTPLFIGGFSYLPVFRNGNCVYKTPERDIMRCFESAV